MIAHCPFLWVTELRFALFIAVKPPVVTGGNGPETVFSFN